MEEKYVSLIDRWGMDVKSYESGVSTGRRRAFCKECVFFETENALNCKKYVNNEKPSEILHSKRECEYFSAKNPIEIDVEENSIESKKIGALFGFVCGDMIGVPVEFENRTERKEDPVKNARAYGTYNQPIGTWSDDTSLTLALIDCVNKGFSMSSLTEGFVEFLRQAKYTPYGKVFDIGNTTITAISNIEKGVPYSKCGGKEESDNGNGSLMRILPLGLLWGEVSDEKIIPLVEGISMITHAHPRSQFACLFYAYLVKELLVSESKEAALNETINYFGQSCFDEKYGQERKIYNRIISKEILTLSENDIKSTGYVVDSLEASIWCFLKEDSTKEIILKAVNLGGDTDTIAAIAGGLAGAFYGINDVPNNWIQLLAKKEMLLETFRTFVYSKGDV